MIVLAKLELALLIIVMAHIHEVLKLSRILWLTLIVLFSLTAINEPSASQNYSLLICSHSSHLLIFYDCLVFFLFTSGYN